MNIFLEICLIGCIIYLTYQLLILKQEKNNADLLNQKNQDLENQLNQNKEALLSQEANFKQVIQNLQSNFNQERAILKEAKLELQTKEEKLLKEFAEIENKLLEETANRKKVTSQKKSSEVRLGGIAETLAPFLDQFDFDPENCTFLGKPIDYISFADDEITFIEVKSGNSNLNSHQKNIKDAILKGRVHWHEHTADGIWKHETRKQHLNKK